MYVCAAGMHHRSIMGRRSTLTAALPELEASREQLRQQLFKVQFLIDVMVLWVVVAAQHGQYC